MLNNYNVDKIFKKRDTKMKINQMYEVSIDDVVKVSLNNEVLFVKIIQDNSSTHIFFNRFKSDSDINKIIFNDEELNAIKINYNTPLAQAILGKTIFDEFSYQIEGQINKGIILQIIKYQKNKNDRKNKVKLLYKLQRYGFNGFFHTTGLNNFIKMYKSGYLYSRKYLEENGIKFDDNADPDVIKRTSSHVFSFVRLYYRAKTPTNYSAYYNFGQKHPVLLQFDNDIIFDDVCFCNGNASSKYTEITPDANVALETFDWDLIFGYNLDGVDNYIIKNKRNAELLYNGRIHLSKVKYFVFKTEEDMNFAISQLSFKDPRFIVDKRMFF